MKLKNWAFVLLLIATPAFAADVDGTWAGSIDSPNGAIALSYTFKADGETLTGTTLAPDGATTLPITDGKIKGNKLTFTLTLDFGQGPTTFNYTGELNGKDMKLHTEFMGMPIDMDLKKS